MSSPTVDLDVSAATTADVPAVADADTATLKQSVSLGERMKGFEKEDRVQSTSALLVRLDGKTFSTFTRPFEKPFDPRFTAAMVKTLNQLVSEYRPSTGFCCSDEITLVFPPTPLAENGTPTERPFGGRTYKFATLLAGKCSTYFVLNLLKVMEHDPAMISHILRSAPCFDARIIDIPHEQLHEVCNNILWRSLYDCRRNSISSYGRHVLGTGAVHGKGGGEMIELMKAKGFNFDELELYKVYGVYAKKREVLAQTPHGEFHRRSVFNFECVMKSCPEMLEFLLRQSPYTAAELGELETGLGVRVVQNDAWACEREKAASA